MTSYHSTIGNRKSTNNYVSVLPGPDVEDESDGLLSVLALSDDEAESDFFSAEDEPDFFASEAMSDFFSLAAASDFDEPELGEDPVFL